MTATDQALQSLKSNLERRIALLGTSARDVSERAGLNPGAVGDILSGRSKNPGLGSLSSIARALGCEVADLLGETHPDLPRRGTVPDDNVADAIRAIFEPLGGVELELPSRKSHRKLPDFSEKEDDAA